MLTDDEKYKKHQDRIQEFYSKYPLCFPKPPYCGFSCGEGWFGPLNELCSKIEQILTRLPEDERGFQVAQVKEKFGGLRFYIDGPKNKEAYDDIQVLIGNAESACYKLCEDCGNPGTRRNSGWIKVRCDDCEKEYYRQRRLQERESIISSRAQESMGDWKSYYDLPKEDKDRLLKEAEKQLLNEGGIKPIDQY